MRDWLLNWLAFFPSRALLWTPAAAELRFDDVVFEAEDGERLHGWWIPALRPPSIGHLLYCHGNGGNIGDRVPQARALADAGLDVLLFDYRGYGRSSGSPDEPGTYRDGRAALRALLSRPGVDAGRVVYLGESLGGGVALALALESPPLGLVLESTFTSVREMARLHYPLVPRALVPDAYPNLARIAGLRAPLLVIHGERDEVVPLAHGQALFASAPEPKWLRVVAGAGHNDLALLAGRDYGAMVAWWVAEISAISRSSP